MSIDLACLVLLVLAAGLGALKGAVPQVARVGAVLAGWGGARWLGPKLAPVLQGRVPAFAAHPIAAVLTFLACTMAARILVRVLLAMTPLRQVPGSRADRGLGALLGGLHAAVIAWVLLSALAVWNRPVHVGSIHADPQRSELVGFAREFNAFGSLLRAHQERAGAP